jgi:hypothetical protein
MSGWVWLVSGVNGLPHRAPDDQGAIEPLVARGFTVTDLPGEWNSDDEEFIAALAKLQAVDQAADLKGKALDEALDDAGLSKSGTVAEKQARLAEFNASEGTVEADPATNQEGINNG